jgi:hypothetical protein
MDGRGHRSAQPGDAGIGHAAVVGAVVGYFVAFTIVAGILLVARAGLGAALAVGGYVAIWGGPGFGGMVNAQRYADRIAAEERIARQDQNPTSGHVGQVLVHGPDGGGALAHG